MSNTPTAYIWTPQDFAALSAANPAKSALRVYGLATGLANRKTGLFTATKAWAASQIGACKRTADNGFAELIALGVISRAEVIRSKRQRANVWTLNPRRLWRFAAISAAARYRAILDQLERQRVAKRERLQLLNGANSFGAGTQQQEFKKETYSDIAQRVARNAIQQGYGTDYARQEREITDILALR